MYQSVTAVTTPRPRPTPENLLERAKAPTPRAKRLQNYEPLVKKAAELRAPGQNKTCAKKPQSPTPGQNRNTRNCITIRSKGTNTL